MDLKIVETGEGDLDLSIESGDLQTDTGLDAAIRVSLGTDAPAEEGDTLPDNSGYRGGWWCDALTLTPLGSKLWLYRRSKISEETLADLSDVIEAGLSWMVDIGMVSAVTALLERDRSRRDRVLLTVRLERSAGQRRAGVPSPAPGSAGAGADPLVFQYSYLWNEGRIAR